MPAITTSPSAQLAMSTIRQFLQNAGNGSVPSTTNLSLSNLEFRYMGNNTTGTGAIVTTAKVCMWRQQETFNLGPIPPGPGLNPDPTAYTPGSTNKPWDYYGGTGVPWRPSRFSEFQQAYYNPPSGVGYGVATGATNSTGIIRFDFAGGSRAALGTGSYYLYIYNGGGLGVTVPGWYSTAGTRIDFGTGTSAFAQAYVVDDKFCGGQMVLASSEITTTGSASYP